jgi:hypothetical protein
MPRIAAFNRSERVLPKQKPVYVIWPVTAQKGSSWGRGNDKPRRSEKTGK